MSDAARRGSVRRGSAGMVLSNMIKVNVDQPPFTEQARAAQREADAKPGSFLARNNEMIIDLMKAAAFLGLYSLAGILLYSLLEPEWTRIDAFYFCMMTMSTVGYGDISPSSDVSRAFTLCMIVVGIVFVFVAVSNAIGHVSGPITRKGRQLMEKLFPQVGVSLDGTGKIDYYKPRPPAIYYLKNLTPSFMLSLVVQIFFAAVFTQLTGDDDHEPWTFGLALYHCLVTSTTVGYGDVSNATQTGRLWASFHIIVAVALLGELLGTIGELAMNRAETLKRIACLERQFDRPLLNQLLERAVSMRPKVKRDGKGLTELEFVLAMCIELDVVQVSQRA